MSDIGITSGTVITMDEDYGIINNGGVIISNSEITDIGKTKRLKEEYDPKESIDATNSAIIPGLIDSHVHVSDILFRNGAKDTREMYDWLYNIKIPGVGGMTPEDHAIASALYSTEFIQAGGTTFVENGVGDGSGYDEDVVASKIDVYDQSGIRNVFGQSFSDSEPNLEVIDYIELEMAKEPTVDHVHPTDVVSDTSEALENIQQLIEDYHGENDGRQSVWPAPLFAYMTTPDGLKGAYDIAETNGVMMTTHTAESEHEIGFNTPVEYLDTVGALGERSLLGHCIYLSNNDIRLIKKADAKVAHNPLTNMALGMGHAPVPTMIEYGVDVGLGTDNSSASDTVNMLNDLRFAATIHKGHQQDSSVTTAKQVLRMATIEGARAIGREDNLGSLTVGKKADIAIVDLEHPHLTPQTNVISTLVYQTQGFEVDTVLCNGDVIMRNRKVTGLSAKYPDLIEMANSTAEEVTERVSIPTTNT